MAAPSQIFLVIGASRGIGQGLVEQLSAKPDSRVIATTRKPTTYSQKNVENLVLDQTDPKSVEEAAKKVAEVDTIILNAAIGDDEMVLSTSEQRFQEYLNTNVVGVHRVINAFLPALRTRKTRKIVIMSSVSGSVTTMKDSKFGFRGPYSVTKAANNMQAVMFHNELREEGFIVIPIHPGWVSTDMGNKAGDGAMPISESVSGMIKVVDSLKPEDSGKFFQYDGSSLPW